MGFENRFKGNKAWMWMDPLTRKVTYQFFVFEDKDKAEEHRPEGTVVTRAEFDGEMWVECEADEDQDALLFDEESED
jgi:hypothetical protein